MAHNHSHGHSHNHSGEESSKNIIIAFFLNLVFAIIELIGGLLTNSVAILSDSVHDFGDSISLLIAWLFQKKSQQTRDAKYSYGYKRFSLLGSVFLSGVLFVGSMFIFVEAVKRLFDPQPVHAQGMFWLAILGIVVNGVAALRVKKGKSLNERVVYIHIMEDVLGWFGVLVVSIVMLFVDIPILDPILSVAITIWVLYNVYNNLRDTFKILLQAVPDDVDIEKLKQDIEGIENLISIHDFHIWTQDGISHVMTLHAVADKDQFIIKEKIREIAQTHDVSHVTVEFEPSNIPCEYEECKE
ncbi:MAG: cation diffusion facilitator family transporter [Bacteroidales bacterium]|nr:cation diffusion facilitator family transporter [Bacteroidales bacterium]MDD4683934.1 cation diffusion facilitator family transporter [Bacteroidales bacterium]